MTDYSIFAGINQVWYEKQILYFSDGRLLPVECG